MILTPDQVALIRSAAFPKIVNLSWKPELSKFYCHVHKSEQDCVRIYGSAFGQYETETTVADILMEIDEAFADLDVDKAEFRMFEVPDAAWCLSENASFFGRGIPRENSAGLTESISNSEAA